MANLSWWDKKRMGDVFFLAIGVLIIFLIVRQVMKNSPKKEKMMGNGGMGAAPAAPSAQPAASTESGFDDEGWNTKDWVRIPKKEWEKIYIKIKECQDKSSPTGKAEGGGCWFDPCSWGWCTFCAKGRWNCCNFNSGVAAPYKGTPKIS